MTVNFCFVLGKGDDNCLGWRPSPGAPYSWLTFNEVHMPYSLSKGVTLLFYMFDTNTGNEDG